MIKGNKFLVLSVLVMILVLSVSSLAFAHSTWLNATNYAPKFDPATGAKSKVYVGFGHRYPLDDFFQAEKIEELTLLDADGKKQNITLETTGFLAGTVQFKKAGIHTAAMKKKPAYYTTYMENGTKKSVSTPKTGLNNIVSSYYYEEYSKCLFNVGGKKNTAPLKPIGQRFEIVPLENPYGIDGSAGHLLPVKVLLNGAPAKACKIAATNSAGAGTITYTTDNEGIALIKITHWGVWWLKADTILPVPANMQEQCNEIHYTAAITFEVP